LPNTRAADVDQPGRLSDVFKVADIDARANAVPRPHLKLEQATVHQMKRDLRKVCTAVPCRERYMVGAPVRGLRRIERDARYRRIDLKPDGGTAAAALGHDKRGFDLRSQASLAQRGTGKMFE